MYFIILFSGIPYTRDLIFSGRDCFTKSECWSH